MYLRDHHSLTPHHLYASRCFIIKILSMMRLFLPRGRGELVAILLAGGANPNMRTGPPQKTLLQLAAAGGHMKVMEMLVKRGANWKDKDEWGCYFYARSGYPLVVKFCTRSYVTKIL